MGIKSFFVKKMLTAKGVPPEQAEMVMMMMEKDPELFKKIAKEVEQKKKEGKNETAATMEVMRKYQGDLQKLMK